MGKKIPEYNDEQVATALLSGGRPYATELTHALELPLSMLDVPVLPVRQVAELTTSAIHQKDSDAWKRCFEKHKKWLDNDIREGTIKLLDPDTYMPFWPGDIIDLSDNEFHSALVTIDDFGKFARSLGIYVTIESPAQQVDVGSQESSPQPDSSVSSNSQETPEQRRTRLMGRKKELLSVNKRSFLKIIASEEKISVSRVKQLLSNEEKQSPIPGSTLAMLSSAKKKTR